MQLVSSLRPSLIIASHYQVMYIILVLDMIAILISENMFLWHVASASIVFMAFTVFGAIFIFQLPKF